MSAPRILLTGGSGFVGAAILHQCIERHNDWLLFVADVDPPEAQFASAHSVQYIKTDVRDRQQCLQSIETTRPTVIIHAAGKVPGGLTRYSRKGKDELFALNVGGTQNMLDAAKRWGVTNFIFTGSCTSITDDLDHDYPNFTEDVPFPAKALIYGESKVRGVKARFGKHRVRS